MSDCLTPIICDPLSNGYLRMSHVVTSLVDKPRHFPQDFADVDGEESVFTLIFDEFLC